MIARFTIELYANRADLHVEQFDKSYDPYNLLDWVIDELECEKADLSNCPFHKEPA